MEIIDLYPEGSKVLLIGSYPPPLGGISVHIYRLEKKLKRKSCLPEIFDISRKGIPGIKTLQLLTLLVFQQWDIVHIHSAAPVILRLITLTKKIGKFRVFFTDHNPRLFYQKTVIKIKKIRKFIQKTDVLILVTEQIYRNYLAAGIILPKEWYVKEAFLPPPLDEEETIKKSYPESLPLFIENHSPLLFANAFQLNFYNNEDLYGLDMCIELSVRLKNHYPDHGFLFALANEQYNQPYLQQIKEKIKQQNLSTNFFFLTGQQEIWPLYKKVSIFLRPTNSDGDAISIREALFFHTPVIASDACPRPERCVSFRSRDNEDLFNKTIALLTE